MGRVALIAMLLVLPKAAASGMQPYSPSNSPQTYSTTSPSYGTATATIQETSGQSTSGGWTFCAHHAVDGSSCASASHLPAGTVSKWIAGGATTLVTLQNGAQCYQHTDSAGVNWCYAGEPVQDSLPATGGPFGTSPDTSIGELPNQGEAWWGSGGGPNDASACEGMFGYAPSNQASLPSCEQQFGTVTWDTSGGTVASIGSTVDEMAWRIGSWNGGATPGGVTCGSRTAIGDTNADSQAPNGLWMQWSSSPARGFWNCTAEDGAAGPPQPGWNGSSWYSRSYADWNGFGWYLVYYDYASFIELPATTVNGVATSINCGGYSSGTSVSNAVPTSVAVTIDETSGLATFTDQNGTVLSEVSCTNSPTPRTTVTDAPPSTSPPPGGGSGKPYASIYALYVPIGESGAINVLSQNVYTGTPKLSLISNSAQPGSLDTDPASIDFGYFAWTPTYPDVEKAYYEMCDSTGCATAYVEVHSYTSTTSTTVCQYYCGQPPPTTAAPPTTLPPSPNVTLREGPTPFPSPGQTVTFTATASNPTSPTYDLSIERVDDGALVADCGQVLTCTGNAWSETAVTQHFVAVLSYPSPPSTPSQYSNEVTVSWSGPAVGLTACLTSAACPDTTATPPSGAPVYLTATAYNVSPVDQMHQVYWKLVIVDNATRQAVGDCPIGESPCQVQVTQPDGTEKTYFAMWSYEQHPESAAYSNTVDVRWGRPTTTTTATTTTTSTTSIPPTTSVPPTTSPPPPPTTSPPPPPTTSPPPPPTTSPPPPPGVIRPT
ncbi:MAG: hypothetical protein ACYDH6_18540 [Acidimicrobiales bacterium]